MPNQINHKSILLGLMGSVAFCVPSLAYAQQTEPEWTSMDDGADAPAESSSTPARKTRSGPRVQIAPYIEAQQVLVADLKNGGDVLTYSTVAVGVDAAISTQRAKAQVNVRYERLIGYDNGLDDQDVISGLARGSVAVGGGLSLETGALATRTRVDGRGSSTSNLVGNPDNVTQIYSVYVGPTFATQVGDLSVNAAYRAGYTKVESKQIGSLPPGQQQLDIFDDSVSHSAIASVGMQPGVLPVGWAVSTGYDREDAGQLDQRYEDKFVRADVTVPVSPNIALIGGVGYEDIKISERDALRDGLGDPIRDADGRLVTDPNSPRLVAYQEDGLIWDAGVMWRPSNRTSLSATYGHRYGSDSYTGSFNYQPNDRYGVNVFVYDTVSGFGHLVNNSLANLPTQFRSSRNPLSGDINSCAFSQSGGYCLNDALQTAASSAFRSRGITAAISSTAGGWDSGFGVGYNRRKFIASQLGAQAQIDGLIDQSYFAAAYLGRELDTKSRVDTNVYVNYFDPGFLGAADVLGMGINTAYYRQIIRGLSATAAVGLDSYKQEDFDSALTGSALLGLRYTF